MNMQHASVFRDFHSYLNVSAALFPTLRTPDQIGHRRQYHKCIFASHDGTLPIAKWPRTSSSCCHL